MIIMISIEGEDGPYVELSPGYTEKQTFQLTWRGILSIIRKRTIHIEVEAIG